MISEKLISLLPKTDLHVHLDGSLRLSTLIELAREQGVELPSYTEAGLKELVFKDRYSDLPDYLHGFKYTCAVLRTPEALERVAYELALDHFAEGVRYFEARFAPQLNMTDKMGTREVLRHVDSGFKRAMKEVNSRPEIANGSEPRLVCGIIGCAMRKFTAGFSPYYEKLFSLHPNLPPTQVYSLASDNIVRTLIQSRDEDGTNVVGFDLAGEEKGYPAENHARAYQFAHDHFLHTTVHAGEAYGPPSIYQAITDCHAERIGHGTHLFRPDMVDLLDDPEDQQRYTDSLSQHIADRRITIEVCLTSNLQTMPEIKSLAMHPFKQMNEQRLSVTFCTDNRLVSNTTVTKEIVLAQEAFGLSAGRLRHLMIYGFKRSFFPGTYLEKRKYVREVIDFYDRIASN